MKKFLLATLSLLAFSIQSQNYSPSTLLQFELLLQEHLVPYQGIRTIDLSVAPPDTFSRLEVSTQNGVYTSGLEIVEGDSLSWIISSKSNHYQVDITDTTGNVLLREKIYTNAQNQDTLIEVFMDTAGSGTLSKAQDVRISYDSLGMDSLFTFVQAGQLAGATLTLGAERDSLGRLDTVATEINYMGTPLPVEYFTYHYDTITGRIDSILVQNPNDSSVAGKFVPVYGGHGYIANFTFFEVDNFGEFMPVVRYEFTPVSDLTLPVVHTPSFSIYPNPAAAHIHLSTPLQGNISIYTQAGQRIWSAPLKGARQQFDVSPLPRGTYLVAVKNEKGLLKMQKLQLH